MFTRGGHQCNGITRLDLRCMKFTVMDDDLPHFCWMHCEQKPLKPMRVICTTQNDGAWHEARRGKITASMLAAVFAGPKTRRRHDYRLRLVMDLEGVPDFEDDAPWFEDGKIYEQYARGWYSWTKGVDVAVTGFVLHPFINFIGCSPDGIPALTNAGLPGGLEIKFRKSLKTFHASKHKAIGKPTLWQMQLQMLCCQWAWIDYLNYWRNDENEIEQGHIQRIPRNVPIQNIIEKKCLVFWCEVCALYLKRNGKPPMIT